MSTNQWTVDLRFSEDDVQTTCTATLQGQGAPTITGEGRARRNPADEQDVVIGEEIAAARACSALTHELLDLAADKIESHTHRPAHVSA